jgi:hypothetical protein
MKPFDAAPVLAAWPTLEPDYDFADRVLAAYDAPPVANRRRWPLYACAAALLVMLSPLVTARHHGPHGSAAVIAHGDAADLDLGLQTD